MMLKIKQKLKHFLKWICNECKDRTTILLFAIVVVLMYSPVWGGYLLHAICGWQWCSAAASVVLVFWAGPFTPFFPICMAITLGIKRIMEVGRTGKQISDRTDPISSLQNGDLIDMKDSKEEYDMEYATIEMIFSERKNDPNGYSFEYEQKEVSVIRDEADRRYLRVYKKQCAAEGNGRPVTTIRDVCYPIDAAAKVDAANWKTFKKYSQRILLEDRSFEGV